MAAATTKVKDVPLKGGGFEWVAVARDQWHGKVAEGKLPPRIRQLDAKTFCCYRDGKYLGSEPSMKDAFERIKANHASDKNISMALWQKAHPDELPPGLALTDAERAEYWRHNPPKGGKVAAPLPSRGVAPRREPTVPLGVVTGRTPSADPAQSQRPAKEPRAPKAAAGNKDAEIRTLLLRGCTSQEVLRVTGWTAISMPAMAKKLGLALRIEKGVKPFKYYGSEK